LELGNPIAHHATTRADRTIWPKHGFHVLARFVVIVENRVAKIEFFAGHCVASLVTRQPYIMGFDLSTG
jgi:hypothetical protein